MDELKRARERRASRARHPSQHNDASDWETEFNPPAEGYPQDQDTPFWQRENPITEQDKPFWQQQDRPFRGMESGRKNARKGVAPRQPAGRVAAGEENWRQAGQTPRQQERRQRQDGSQVERQKPARAERKSGRAGHAALLMLLGLLVLTVFIGMKVFEIQTIEVKGADSITPESVIALSGVAKGDNIFKVSLQQAKQNLESDPLVEVIGISRVFPDKIKIEIRQRKPHGAIAWLSGYVVIDEKGVVLDVRDSLPAGQYPLVTGIDISPAERGGQIKCIDTNKLIVMENLLTALFDNRALQYISEVNLSDAGRIMLLTGEGLRIDLGKPADLAHKAKWIASTVPELRNKGYTGGILYITGMNSPVYSATGDGGTEQVPGDNNNSEADSIADQNNTGQGSAPENAA